MIVKNVLYAVSYLLTIQINLTEQQFRSLLLERQTMQSYCSAFKTCNDCKNGAFQCEWCHDVGCTKFPRLHCPMKLFLDKTLKNNSAERFCTEIVSKSPIFVPAYVNRMIKLDLKIDDMTLYNRNIVCEIRIENNIIEVKGMLEKNTVECGAIILSVKQPVALGTIRLIWGGVSPYSNVILMVVYKCRHLAETCMGCQTLSKEFQCGWCKKTSTCNLMEECPMHWGPWIDKNLTCERYESKAFTEFRYQHGNWYK